MPLTPSEEQELLTLESSLGGLKPEEAIELQELENQTQGHQFFKGVSEDLTKRGDQAQQSGEWYKKGEIGFPEYAGQMAFRSGAGAVGDVVGRGILEGVEGAQALDDFFGGYGQDVLGTIVNTVGKLPSAGGGTLGENIPNEVMQLYDKYQKFAEKNPRAAANIESAVNAVTLGVPVAKSGEKVIQGGAGIFQNLSRKQLAKMTAKELSEIGGNLFKKADDIGGKVKPEFWDDYIRDVSLKMRPKQGERIAERVFDIKNEMRPILQNMRAEINDLGSFSAIKKTDQILNDLYYQADKAGDAAVARKYLIMRNTLRDKIENADPDMFIGGSEAFDTVKEAKKIWAASRRMDDVEKILQRAEGAQQPTTVIKNGFRKLRDSKDFKFYSPDEKFAIKKAANTGAIEGFFRLQGSGLGPIITGGVGYAAGGPIAGTTAAAGSYALMEGMKGASEGIARSKGGRVLDAIQSTATGEPPPYIAPSVKLLGQGLKQSTTPIGAVSASEESLADRARRIYKK